MPTNDGNGAYAGSRYSEVRAQLLSDPYTGTLPRYDVTIGSFFKAGKSVLWRDSRSVIDREADMVPPMQKLVNPLGICFFGRWKITEETPYTGCLRTGTEHLIIVRCSNLLTNALRGTWRSFGFAGKIFPTLDPDELVETVNLTCLDDFGGTYAERFADVELSNEPPTSLHLGLAFPNLFVSAYALWTFVRAEKAPTYRSIYPLYEHGLAPGEKPRGPKWIRITTEEGIGRSDAADFRDELRLANYKDGVLRFVVSAAEEKKGGKKLWRRIGVVDLNEEVCSASGDHRLRFRHYPNR